MTETAKWSTNKDLSRISVWRLRFMIVRSWVRKLVGYTVFCFFGVAASGNETVDESEDLDSSIFTEVSYDCSSELRVISLAFPLWAGRRVTPPPETWV